MSDARARRCLDPGLSILVATVNAAGAPSCCRAIALASEDDLATATVYLPIATSQRIIQDVATTRRIAVAATHIVDHCSVQLKGTTATARIAREDEAVFVRARLEGFAAMLHQVGMPLRLARSMAHWPAFAVEMRVEEVFDQTPGPNAGGRLR